MNLPKIIQGGMGVAISDWQLAKAVSQLGQLGVVSGTGVSRVLVSRLMDGDLNGHARRALASFSLLEPVQNILKRYYISGGKTPETPYKTPAAYSIHPPKSLDQLTAIANFVEVFLAKEGHSGLVGINLMEKVQMPNLASLYGAMLEYWTSWSTINRSHIVLTCSARERMMIIASTSIQSAFSPAFPNLPGNSSAPDFCPSSPRQCWHRLCSGGVRGKWMDSWSKARPPEAIMPRRAAL